MTLEPIQNQFRTSLEPSLKDIIDLSKSQYSIKNIIGHVTKQQIILMVLMLLCFVFRETISSLTIEIKLWTINIAIGVGVEIARVLVQPCVNVACA